MSYAKIKQLKRADAERFARHVKGPKDNRDEEVSCADFAGSFLIPPFLVIASTMEYVFQGQGQYA